jgi:putative ABC transport system permease protein
MTSNLLLTGWRALKKNKFFSALNILGLVIGMTVFLLIAQFVQFEKSYESFLPHADDIYRVSLKIELNNELVTNSAENYPGAGPAMKADLPEVVSFARLYNMGYKNNVIITNEEAKPDPIAFKQRRFMYADSAFLSMMGYPMVHGDPATALAEPFTAVISETYARMYFGDEDPMGKMLRLQDDDFINELVKVTGVFKDLPASTHLKFDVLFSYESLFARGEWAVNRYGQGWGRKDMYTFVQLARGADPKAVEAKLPALVDKYKPNNKAKNQLETLSLQPLKSIHLTSNLAEETEINGDQKTVDYLAMIGLFVLIIAWINYINLSTAKAMERAREVGVRKVMGARQSQLVRQFMTEALLTNLISVVVALGLAFLLLPLFNSISGLRLDFTYLTQPWFIGLSLVLLIGGTLLSGAYPAFILSSMRPVASLKGKLKNSTSGILMRKSLVVFQFMASVAFIAGTIIVYNQLRFMQKQNLGMNIDQVVAIERPGISPQDQGAFKSAIDLFRNEVKNDPSVVAVTSSATVPGKQREYKAVFKRYGAPSDEQVTLRLNSMDYEFKDVYGIKVLAGRLFEAQHPEDQDTSVVVTESAARILGFPKPEDAVGQAVQIEGWNVTRVIVGVVNDYAMVSLKKAIDPSLFFCSLYDGEHYSIRLNTTDPGRSVNNIREAWTKAFPGNPFEYYFLDEFFNRQYENEKRFGLLFTTFATLAVIVGCLGLLGLSAYSATQRTKEIGIRKALGSSEPAIFMLLSKEYLKLIGIAILLATPLIWWVMNGWMQTFPYRSGISAFVFVVAGAIVLIVALLTISYQTVRAAKTNPVDSLRYE